MDFSVLAEIKEAVQYGFIQRAILAGAFIALCCSLLGVFLVLRRFSLIGDGLAHVSFGVIGLSLLLQTHPVYFSIPLVMLASLWILQLTERAKIHGDAAIGLTSALGVATGVMLASVAGGFNVDLFSYLFGNILVITPGEVMLSVVLSFTVLLVVVLLFHDLFAITFEEEYASTLGIRTGRINMILVLCTALTVVLGIRVVGVMLVSSLIIFPAVTALQVASGFKTAILVAAVSSIVSVWLGILLSFVFDLPTGATIVFVNFGWFAAAYAYARLSGR
jgi:zinc transport system permease protein